MLKSPSMESKSGKRISSITKDSLDQSVGKATTNGMKIFSM